MKECPHCKQPIPDDSLFCLYCGDPVDPYPRSKWIAPVAIIAVLAFILLMLAAAR